MLTYAGTTLRPTKEQFRQLRTATCSAAHGNKLGAFSARNLFQKNYLLTDPEFAFVWRSLLFWNKHAFKQHAFKDAVTQIWEKVQPSIKKIGPVSQLKKDMEYLQLHLNVDNLHDSNEDGRLLWTFGSSDCKVVRKALCHSFRHKIASELEHCNSSVWKGVSNYDFGTTTALLHLLPEGHPVRQKLTRVLINGINSFHTQFVKCRHPDATMAHLFWECPYWSDLRCQWEEGWESWSQWSPCSQHLLVFCKDLPPRLQARRGSIQKQAVDLLGKWEARHRDLRTIDYNTQLDHAPVHVDRASEQRAHAENIYLLNSPFQSHLVIFEGTVFDH